MATNCNIEIHASNGSDGGSASSISMKEGTSSCESSNDDSGSEGELLQKAGDTCSASTSTAAGGDEDCNDNHLITRLLRYIIVMWLLFAYLFINVACSLITPFYPEEVGIHF